MVEKIKKCDLFIADLTPIAKNGKKDLPNPNVMMELGVAKASMIDAVILLLYSGEIDANRMPFDINHQRMSRFSKAKSLVTLDKWLKQLLKIRNTNLLSITMTNSSIMK